MSCLTLFYGLGHLLTMVNITIVMGVGGYYALAKTAICAVGKLGVVCSLYQRDHNPFTAFLAILFQVLLSS